MDSLPGEGRLNMDSAGNLYGTTFSGGTKNAGIVFELSPVGDGTYTFSILHSFVGGKGDGSHPVYGVSFDTFRKPLWLHLLRWSGYTRASSTS